MIKKLTYPFSENFGSMAGNGVCVGVMVGSGKFNKVGNGTGLKNGSAVKVGKGVDEGSKVAVAVTSPKGVAVTLGTLAQAAKRKVNRRVGLNFMEKFISQT